MTLYDICDIKDDAERTNKFYELFCNEDSRLTHGKASRVEFLTTTRYIEKYLKTGDKILDIGAGTGIYSIYFAEKGYDVKAIELADKNVQVFREKITSELKIDLQQGNAVDLSIYEDESFDIVLLFGPLYHIKDINDRTKCIEEAKRVCKKDGKIFIAYISRDMSCLVEGIHWPDFWAMDTYDHDTFEIIKAPFELYNVDECKKMLIEAELDIKNIVASDGCSELLQDKINTFTDEQYEQYLKWHFYTCEKPEMIGHSSHYLFVAEKK